MKRFTKTKERNPARIFGKRFIYAAVLQEWNINARFLPLALGRAGEVFGLAAALS